MKTVGILTVTGDNNYGNKLQNYAMETILTNLGFKAETIRVDSRSYLYIKAITYIQAALNPIFNEKKRERIKRRLSFYRFNNNIEQKTFLKLNSSAEIIRKKLSQYDYLVYGSDQIWNPELPQYSDIFLGKYAPKEKNIAVSASMGISSIPEKYVDSFRDGFKNFKAISVREEDAKTAIEALDEMLHAEVLPDPTMMLDSSQWVNVERETGRPEHYCLAYFLGKENTESIRSVVRSIGSELVNANSKSPYGPGEFIYLVRHADAVLTDSYHATIFSAIFGIPVYIYERRDGHTSMNSRISTLLKKTGLRSKQMDDYVYIPQNAIEDAHTQRCIQNERDTFVHFIQDNLKAL